MNKKIYMNHASNPFKKAGIALLTIGVLDIILMIYSIISKISYSSSFNIFAVIVGILLLKGSVKTARLTRWFSLFFSIVLVGGAIGMILIMPFDLLKIQIKLNILSALITFFIVVIFFSLLIWIYRQLSTPEVLKLFVEAGYGTTKSSAYFFGSVVLIFMLGMLTIVGKESEQKAKELARQQLGSNFQYYVSSMSLSGKSGQANVIAYTDKEIRHIQIDW